MKKQRPSIPIQKWTVATNLEKTRAIQNQEGTPAYDCSCEWCNAWKSHYTDLLPTDLQQQLHRVGIKLKNPTDLYMFESCDSGSSVRVVYHAVGKILNGPNQWPKNNLGNMLMYQTIRDEPFLSMVVYPQRDSHDEAPSLEDTTGGELIRIDLRLLIPNET